MVRDQVWLLCFGLIMRSAPSAPITGICEGSSSLICIRNVEWFPWISLGVILPWWKSKLTANTTSIHVFGYATLGNTQSGSEVWVKAMIGLPMFDLCLPWVKSYPFRCRKEEFTDKMIDEKLFYARATKAAYVILSIDRVGIGGHCCHGCVNVSGKI